MFIIIFLLGGGLAIYFLFKYSHRWDVSNQNPNHAEIQRQMRLKAY